MGSWPADVGIIALEIIFPSQYVDQTELEQFDGVSAGKYTVGLGQQRMGFCNDREDINSLCLTVVQNLMQRYNISPKEIGRLEVGTETIIDKSKSVKTVLMQLFEPYGVTDIEGIDTTNACFGGTAALFNAISWVESSAWNGRYALVVAGDIAVYAKGPARPTGGTGAVAMLIGPNAPLVFDRGLRGCFFKHAYDFYKPDLTSEYPVVDGKLSVQCYLEALDSCYQLYCQKAEKLMQKSVTINSFDGILFHTPYCKLVQKSVGRLALNDFVKTSADKKKSQYPGFEAFENVKLQDSYFDRDVEKAFLNVSKECFDKKTKPSLLVATNVGNMYTSSLYGGLVSYIVSKNMSELENNRVALFSYGSGLASSFYSLTIKPSSALKTLKDNLNYVKPLLEKRIKIAPEKFEATLELRQHSAHKVPYDPVGDRSHFFPGTYYLSKVDDKHRRFYDKIPGSVHLTNGNSYS
ncbi:hydroxymethylglutaryl-CoA synthase 1 [Anthonomus grandis grandis]|uniref:hydroxymethylglutaryl-CoA synthase 1 n=1 Tax=Anthonomus grandis grandis TaxID=2921223 RepID=UPI00216636CA|nr:hydroxymethylglutaryl-CoA synthase 1 [Anthonomus grandis grandis]